MTEDAFARRFYADRAELDALGIQLRVDKPAEGFSEQENYSLAPEAFHLPAIAFTDDEHAALQTALSLLDGEFAYAEPLRLALQQITWGRPSPFDSAAQRSVALGMSASAGGAELSARLAKIDTAIARRKRIEFEYFTMQSGEVAERRVDPYLLLYPGPPVLPRRPLARARRRARVPALAHPRQGRLRDEGRARLPAPDGLRPARSTRARSRGSSATRVGTAEIWVSDRIAWHVERNFGPYGEMVDAEDSGRVFRTDYAIPRLLIAWALGYGEHARIAGPPELAAEARERLDAIVERHTGEPFTSVAEGVPPRSEDPEALEAPARSRQEAAIRPERFARLVTLASVLIAAGRAGRRPPVSEVARAAADLRAGAARGHLGPQRRQLRRRRLRDLRRGPGRRDRDRHRALLGHLRPARAAAADRGQRADGGDRVPGHAPLAPPRRRRTTRSRPRSARSAATGCWSAAPAPTTPTSPATSAARSSRAT